jgi:hypothetical protein
MRRSKQRLSFDHLVGAGEQGRDLTRHFPDDWEAFPRNVLVLNTAPRGVAPRDGVTRCWNEGESAIAIMRPNVGLGASDSVEVEDGNNIDGRSVCDGAADGSVKG